jgi:hypothetical protein
MLIKNPDILVAVRGLLKFVARVLLLTVLLLSRDRMSVLKSDPLLGCSGMEK